MSFHVLIIDDEPGIAEGLKLLVERYVPGSGIGFRWKSGI